MVIETVGLTGLVIKGKRATVFVDPLDKDTGVGYQTKKADILCLSRPESPYFDKGRVKEAYLIEKPGEYESKGVMIFALPVVNGKKVHIVYHVYLDDVHILHLGGLAKKPKEKFFEDIRCVDILAVPVGGMFSLNPKTARGISNSLEPAYVVPMNYEVEGMVKELKSGLGSVDEFLKLMEAKGVEEENSFKISRSKVSSDEERKTEVVLLRPRGFKK